MTAMSRPRRLTWARAPAAAAPLSIYGNSETATAAAVTEALGIEPTLSHEFGDPHPTKTLAARGYAQSSSRWTDSEQATEASPCDFHGMLSHDRLAEQRGQWPTAHLRGDVEGEKVDDLAAKWRCAHAVTLGCAGGPSGGFRPCRHRDVRRGGEGRGDE